MAITADYQVGAESYAPRLRTSVERLRGALLWLTGFAGAFVFVEPSPYEIASMLAIIVFALVGIRLRVTIMPLIFLLVFINIGFSIAVIPVLSAQKTMLWVVVSWYLAATAIFFAAVLAENTQQRVSLLIRGYTLAAVVASLAGIIGYFHLVPRLSELFLLFGRARGTFNDPNVLGAFLVFPALVALQRTISPSPREMLRGGALLSLFVVALLLSFSRGAWGQFAFCSALLLAFTFIISRSNKERVRIVAMTGIGLVFLVVLIALALSLDQVSSLFAQRASLDQDYDSGHTGRFGRHLLGFLLAIETPFGIGPLQFAKIFPEDPHNSYLNAFMSGGWISGFSYATLVATTLLVGLRFVFVPTPWQKTYIVAYVAYVGLAAESAIIDSDHWRHYFLLLGLLWGLISATWRYRQLASGEARLPPLAPQARPA
jgi:O-antigen ligase